MEFINPKLKSRVVERIKQALKEGGPPPGDSDLLRMCWYHLGLCDELGFLTDKPQGKYMRPALCLMVCEGLGGDPHKALPVAASLELIHRSSLIFDDIQDNSAERNNQPSVQALWGTDQAINAGLAMSSMARLALMSDLPCNNPHGEDWEQITVSEDVSAWRTIECWRVLEKGVIALCYGQYLDLSLQSRNKVSLTEHLNMVVNKTGALFGAACETGAIIAGANPEVRSQARKFGIELGVAFQMHDDYLGIWGDEAEVGKTANDLMERKRSLPVVLAMQLFPDEVITPMNTITSYMASDFMYGKMKVFAGDKLSSEDAYVIKKWMEAKQIDKMVQQQCIEQIAQAQRLLQELPVDFECKAKISEILHTVIDRRK